jgi:hypothetical protein
MGIFDIFRSREKTTSEAPPEGAGVLPLLFGDDAELKEEFDEDASIYRENGLEIIPFQALTVQDVKDVILSRKPSIIHLLANFTDRGFLVDGRGGELALGEVIELAEGSGVRLFIVASQNSFDKLNTQIGNPRFVTVLTIIDRNRHFGAFLRGILAGLSRNPHIAGVYVSLAPQHPEMQVGLPLPGSIAICPTKKGKTIALWSNPQP